MIGAGAGFVALGGYQLLRPAQTELPLLPVGSANAQTAEASTGTVEDMVLGSPDAPVELIEYASFTCPHCARFHEVVLPQIKANYIDTGQVRFVHREVYFDRFGLWAGMVARCAGPDRYFGVVDLIYEGQADWTQGSPAQVAEGLRRIGRVAGMTNDQLDACMTDAEFAQAMLDQYEANMEVHDISGTPAFVIDGQLYSNMSYADMSALLDERIAAAE
jgi:protein-disulfide isomerase